MFEISIWLPAVQMFVLFDTCDNSEQARKWWYAFDQLGIATRIREVENV
jgi:hypothetical protein